MRPVHSPLIGVLNLIDNRRRWPTAMDLGGIAALHAAATDLLDTLRAHVGNKTAEELAAPWQPHLFPGITADLVFARAVGAGARHARQILHASRLPYNPAHTALDAVITAGMACRDALVPSLPAGPLYDDMADWDGMLTQAALWSLAAISSIPPPVGSFESLMSQCVWSPVAPDPANGTAPHGHRSWVRPRQGGPLDHRARPLEQDTITRHRMPDRSDRSTEFTLNGRPLSWAQLCQAMTSGHWPHTWTAAMN